MCQPALGGGACDLVGELMLVCEEGEPTRPRPTKPVETGMVGSETPAFRCGGWGEPQRFPFPLQPHNEHIRERVPTV